MHQTVRVSARLPFAQPGVDELAQDFAPDLERAAWMLGEGEDAADHAELDAIAGAMVQARPDLPRLVEACEALERQVGAVQGALVETQGALVQARGDLAGARGALAGALEWVADERALRAEREAELSDLATLRDALIAERVMLIGQLEEAEGWVLRLARERHGMERQAAAEARRMAAMARDLARAKRGDEGEVTRLHQAMAGMTDALGEQAARVAGLEAQLAQAHVEREQAQERAGQDLAGRYGEIVALTRLLREGEDLARQRACEAAWMRDVWAALRRVPMWWRHMPMVVQRRWQEERLRRRGLFDARAYRHAHRDVVEAGIDPLDHYIAHGMAGGRGAMMEAAA